MTQEKDSKYYCQLADRGKLCGKKCRKRLGAENGPQLTTIKEKETSSNKHGKLKSNNNQNELESEYFFPTVPGSERRLADTLISAYDTLSRELGHAMNLLLPYRK